MIVSTSQRADIVRLNMLFYHVAFLLFVVVCYCQLLFFFYYSYLLYVFHFLQYLDLNNLYTVEIKSSRISPCSSKNKKSSIFNFQSQKRRNSSYSKTFKSVNSLLYERFVKVIFWCL